LPKSHKRKGDEVWPRGPNEKSNSKTILPKLDDSDGDEEIKPEVKNTGKSKKKVNIQFDEVNISSHIKEKTPRSDSKKNKSAATTTPIVEGEKPINTGGRLEFSPYKIEGEEVVIPIERLGYLSDFIKDIGVGLITNSKIAKIKLINNHIPGRLATCEPVTTTQALLEELIWQLRYAMLWKFNYEEWYNPLAGIHIKDSKGDEYYPLIHEAVFIPLSPDDISFIKGLIKRHHISLKSDQPTDEEKKKERFSDS